MKIRLVKAKSILSKCGFPEDDFCINPYSGCTFGCCYCYADFMRRFTGHSQDKWGSYVDVKVNAAEVLGRELKRLHKRAQTRRFEPPLPVKSVVIGSVTDPYQGVEAKYKITRKCLEIICKSRSPASFNILTKSYLVTRDIDLIRKVSNIAVGLTITTTDDEVSRLLEGNAPPASLRLKALQKLNQAGISTYVCINPLLPHFVANEIRIRELLTAIRETGNREVWLEHINLSGNKLKKVKSVLKRKAPEAIKYFEEAKTEEYKSSLNKLIFKILEDYDIKVGGGGIVDHRNRSIIIDDVDFDIEIKKGWKIQITK